MPSSGRIILPIAEPILNGSGQPVSGASMSVYDPGTTDIVILYADSALATPIANPQVSDSAGRFYNQSTEWWADAAQAYDIVLTIPGGGSLSFADVFTVGAASNVSGLAPINSPNFTGVPTAPTPATNDNTSKLATTAYVQAQAYAPLASPTFSGVPLAPTAAVGTNTTQIATTAYVKAEIAATDTAHYYQSGNITVTSAANGTLSHGLGANPTRVEAVYVCTSGINQYAVGDEVPMLFNHGASADYGVLVWAINNSTTLKYQFAADGSILPNASGAGFAATSANFVMKVRAWL